MSWGYGFYLGGIATHVVLSVVPLTSLAALELTGEKPPGPLVGERGQKSLSRTIRVCALYLFSLFWDLVVIPVHNFILANAWSQESGVKVAGSMFISIKNWSFLGG